MIGAEPRIGARSNILVVYDAAGGRRHRLKQEPSAHILGASDCGHQASPDFRLPFSSTT